MTNGQQSTLNPRERLLNDLRDAEYRRAFVEGHATSTVAFQLRMLRKERNWEQRDVADRLGNDKLQPMISRYENPDYGRYSITSLLELAAVFDVALIVRFAPFSELVKWDWSSNPATLCPSSFDKDEKLPKIAAEIHAVAHEQVSNSLGSMLVTNAMEFRQTNSGPGKLLRTHGGAGLQIEAT